MSGAAASRLSHAGDAFTGGGTEKGRLGLPPNGIDGGTLLYIALIGVSVRLGESFFTVKSAGKRLQLTSSQKSGFVNLYNLAVSRMDGS